MKNSGAWYDDGEILIHGHHEYEAAKPVSVEKLSDVHHGNVKVGFLIEVDEFFVKYPWIQDIQIVGRRGRLVRSVGYAIIPGTKEVVIAEANVNSQLDKGRGGKAFGRKLVVDRIVKTINNRDFAFRSSNVCLVHIEDVDSRIRRRLISRRNPENVSVR